MACTLHLHSAVSISLFKEGLTIALTPKSGFAQLQPRGWLRVIPGWPKGVACAVGAALS